MELNKEIFNDIGEIKSDVRDMLLQIASDFIDYLELEEELVVRDVLLTGSIANYNYTDASDIDLHLLVDTFIYDKPFMELLKKYLDAKKVIWNTVHNVKIGNHEVEIYPQDSREVHYSTGVYSLKENEWITEPVKIDDNNYTTIVNSDEVRRRVEKYINYIDYLDGLYRSPYVGVKGDELLEKLEVTKQKLKTMRKEGLSKSGEYSVENVVFKELRRNGYIEKLLTLKREVYDAMQTININKERK